MKIKNLTVDRAAISFERILANKGNRSVVEQAVNDKVSAMVVEKATGHFNRAVEVIRDRIVSPDFAHDPLTSGSRRVGGRAYNRRTVFVKTQLWAGLDYRYGKQPPFSRRMWHKKGNLAAATAPLLNGNHKPRIRTRVTTSGAKGGRIRLAATLDFGTLPAPFDELIGSAFIQRRYDLDVPRFREGSARHWKVVFPEGTRPFIRRLAARFGEEFLTDLRTIR